MHIQFIHSDEPLAVPTPVDAFYVYVPFVSSSPEADTFKASVIEATRSPETAHPIKLPYYNRLHANKVKRLARNNVFCHVTLGENTIMPIYGPNSRLPVELLKKLFDLFEGIKERLVTNYSVDNVACAEESIAIFADTLRYRGLNLTYTMPKGKIEHCLPFYNRDITFSIESDYDGQTLSFCVDVAKGITDTRNFSEDVLRDMAALYKNM